MTSEREAFEKWVRDQSWFKATLGMMRTHDAYTDPCINSRWQGWQARAHLAQPAQPCPYVVSSQEGTSYCRLAENAKPAQAVDVGASVIIREGSVVVESNVALIPDGEYHLTRALSGEKAGREDVRHYVGVAEVIGGYEMGDAGAESRVRWLYNPMPEGAVLYEETLPASPTPDKEGL